MISQSPSLLALRSTVQESPASGLVRCGKNNVMNEGNINNSEWGSVLKNVSVVLTALPTHRRSILRVLDLQQVEVHPQVHHHQLASGV